MISLTPSFLIDHYTSLDEFEFGQIPSPSVDGVSWP